MKTKELLRIDKNSDFKHKGGNPSSLTANASGDRPNEWEKMSIVEKDDYIGIIPRDEKRSKSESAHTPRKVKLLLTLDDYDRALTETAAERDQWKRQYEASLQVIDGIHASRDKLREQRDELLNFVRASVNFYGMCEEDVGAGALGADEANLLIVGRELLKKAEAQ